MTLTFEEDCLKWRGKVLTGKKAHWCNDWDGLPIDETCDEFQSCHCQFPVDREAVTRVLAGLEDEVLRASENLRNRGKGGQHVSFHGDFASAVPSVLNRLEWWCRAFREALKA